MRGAEPSGRMERLSGLDISGWRLLPRYRHRGREWVAGSALQERVLEPGLSRRSVINHAAGQAVAGPRTGCRRYPGMAALHRRHHVFRPLSLGAPPLAGAQPLARTGARRRAQPIADRVNLRPVPAGQHESHALVCHPGHALTELCLSLDSLGPAFVFAGRGVAALCRSRRGARPGVFHQGGHVSVGAHPARHDRDPSPRQRSQTPASAARRRKFPGRRGAAGVDPFGGKAPPHIRRFRPPQLRVVRGRHPALQRLDRPAAGNRYPGACAPRPSAISADAGISYARRGNLAALVRSLLLVGGPARSLPAAASVEPAIVAVGAQAFQTDLAAGSSAGAAGLEPDRPAGARRRARRRHAFLADGVAARGVRHVSNGEFLLPLHRGLSEHLCHRRHRHPAAGTCAGPSRTGAQTGRVTALRWRLSCAPD